MSKKTKTSRSIVIGAISFILSLLIVLCSAVSILSLTALNGNFVAKQLAKSNFAEIEHKRIKENFISYGSAANVDEAFFVSFFTDVVTTETIKSDMQASIAALYNGENVDTTYFSKELKSALIAYANEKEMQMTTDVVEGIDEFTNELIDLYGDYVTFPYAETISPIFVSANKYLTYAIAGTILLGIAAAAVILFSYKKKAEPTAYIASSFGGASLMLLVLPLVVYFSGKISAFSLLDEALYSFFVIFMNSFVLSFVIAGVLLLIVTIILSVLFSKLKGKKAK